MPPFQGGALDHYANSPDTSYKVYKVKSL
ncbi:MAG: hypothetical protein ACD_18C00003G0001, partial [uncultured bacterium]